MSKVNFRELERIENQEDIRSFSKEYLSEVYNAIYKDYKIGFKGIPRKLENINDYFLFCNKDLDIHLIYIRKATGQIILTNPIFTKSDRTVGRVIIHDLTDNIDYNLENKYYYTEEFLNYILSKEYIELEVTNIVGNYLKILGGFNLSLIGEKMFEKDFELNLEPDLKFEDKSYVYKVSKLNKIIYNYDEIIRLIDNNQFTYEFGECIEAYENKKYFVAAAGLGSVLEHLLYLSICKHVDEKDIKLNNKATANDYINRLKKEPFNINTREENHLRHIFSDRNSVVHFNKGIFSKEMCDRLFSGITQSFYKYYMMETRS